MHPPICPAVRLPSLSVHTLSLLACCTLLLYLCSRVHGEDMLGEHRIHSLTHSLTHSTNIEPMETALVRYSHQLPSGASSGAEVTLLTVKGVMLDAETQRGAGPCLKVTQSISGREGTGTQDSRFLSRPLHQAGEGRRGNQGGALGTILNPTQ